MDKPEARDWRAAAESPRLPAASEISRILAGVVPSGEASSLMLDGKPVWMFR